jgi:mannose-6-phosphate isomerase-like protein (cupin superfamily)
MQSTRIGLALGGLALAALAGCPKNEEVGTQAGPPLTIERDASAPPSSGAPSATAPVPSASAAPSDAGPPPPGLPPVTAEVVDVDAKGFHWEHVACEQRIVAVTDGTVKVLGETLAKGDVITVRGKGAYDVAATPKAVVVRAIARGTVCEPDAYVTLAKKVFRAKNVKPLVWAGGTMQATLLVEKDDAPLAYVGLLEGTAAVAEHVHDGSWEILCALEASGDFTLAGQKARLGPRQCVSVPPATKHAWAPDAGSKLRAVQLYAPAGPEQRFRGLAAAAADAGR